MIVETNAADYAALCAGTAPRDLELTSAAIAPPDVMQMLANVAATVRAEFSPASWLVVEGGEVIGLVSVTRPPSNGVVDIGYGIAPDRQRRGAASRAIADVAAWADRDSRVAALTAETNPGNAASQRVLVSAGFVQTGERVDDEDGRVLCWRRDC